MTAGQGASAPELPPPEERGSLRIDQAVVRKVARHSADQVPGTTTAPRRLAGVGVGAQGTGVKVTASGDDVELALELALRYPGAVRPVVEQVRTTVAEEVHRITAYRVRAVRVTVSALLSETSSRVE